MIDITFFCYCLSILLLILIIFISVIGVSIKSKKNNNTCYEDGEITNICTMIALKTIKREYRNNLSEIEKDAIDKAIKNTISIENVYNFINSKNDIDNNTNVWYNINKKKEIWYERKQKYEN